MALKQTYTQELETALPAGSKTDGIARQALSKQPLCRTSPGTGSNLRPMHRPQQRPEKGQHICKYIIMNTDKKDSPRPQESLRAAARGTIGRDVQRPRPRWGGRGIARLESAPELTAADHHSRPRHNVTPCKRVVFCRTGKHRSPRGRRRGGRRYENGVAHSEPQRQHDHRRRTAHQISGSSS